MATYISPEYMVFTDKNKVTHIYVIFQVMRSKETMKNNEVKLNKQTNSV